MSALKKWRVTAGEIHGQEKDGTSANVHLSSKVQMWSLRPRSVPSQWEAFCPLSFELNIFLN